MLCSIWPHFAAAWEYAIQEREDPAHPDPTYFYGPARSPTDPPEGRDFVEQGYRTLDGMGRLKTRLLDDLNTLSSRIRDCLNEPEKCTEREKITDMKGCLEERKKGTKEEIAKCNPTKETDRTEFSIETELAYRAVSPECNSQSGVRRHRR
jgi:hypothetical protein